MATGCVTGREAASISNREETPVSVREDGEGTDRKRESGEREVSATCKHPSSSSSDKGCINVGDEKPLCRVTAYARTGESNSDHVPTASKEKATKVKKKKKNGKKKDAHEKRGASTGPSETDKSGDCIGDLDQNMRSLAIDDGLLARGPVRNKDCYEQRNKPYTRAPDHDVFPFINSLLPDDVVRDRPTANVSPQTRNGGPPFTQHQLQQQQQLFLQQQSAQHPQQVPQMLQQQSAQHPQQVPQMLQQQSAQHPQQVPQMLQQQLLYSPTPGSAPPSIPFSSLVPVQFCAPSQIQGVPATNGGVAAVPQVILLPPNCVPVHVNGQTFIQVQSNPQYGFVNAPQVSTQAQATVPTSTLAQNLPFNVVNGITHTATSRGQIENSPATIVDSARDGIPTVVPDTLVFEEPPKTKRVRGRKPNPKGKAIEKKKTQKTSAIKVSSVASVDAGTADINPQAYSQTSGVPSSSSHNTGPRSASSECRERDSANISNTGNFGFAVVNVEPERNEPGDVEHGRIGPGSVGPSSVGLSSVGPESVRSDSGGPNVDFTDFGSFGPSSNGSYLSVHSGSVAPVSVGTAIATDDEVSSDINDFLKEENSMFAIEDRDESFCIAGEIIESDLKDKIASRNADVPSGTLLQTQQDTTFMNSGNQLTASRDEEIPFGFCDQQGSTDLIDMILSESPSVLTETMNSFDAILEASDQISSDQAATSEQRSQLAETKTHAPVVSTVGDVDISVPAVNHVPRHFISNFAQGHSVEVDVRNDLAQSAPGLQNTTRQSGSLQLNARVQIGLNRMSPQTSLNLIMESFRQIAPKDPN